MIDTSGRPAGENGLAEDGWLEVGPVLLAIGHSARDTIRLLAKRGVPIDTKPFQLGVRIEHLQERVNQWQYGAAAGHERLAPAEYHLVAKHVTEDEGDLFSFCMCPGGIILPTNESDGLIATNGASRSQRSGKFGNSGLVITLDPKTRGHSALEGLKYQEDFERRAFEMTGGSYRVPAQRASDFLEGKASTGPLETSFPLGAQWADVRALMSEEVVAALDRGLPILNKKFPGFSGSEAMITAPETRASAPVRIVRDQATREAETVANLFPIGEGAGYAGGIVSAAVDGIKSADVIMRTYAPCV